MKKLIKLAIVFQVLALLLLVFDYFVNQPESLDSVYTSGYKIGQADKEDQLKKVGIDLPKKLQTEISKGDVIAPSINRYINSILFVYPAFLLQLIAIILIIVESKKRKTEQKDGEGFKT